jgi:hypothetical protein
VERDWRDDRIEELETLVAWFRRRVVELEAQLAQFSGNSSRPPSTDPPGAPPPSRPKRTGRRRGGQPGHEKHTRALVPPEQVDKIQTCKPKACRRCGKAIAGNDPDPYRHQVIEIPRAKATVEEFQLHALGCETCGITTRATLPPGVPTSPFGPRLQALVAVLSGAYRYEWVDVQRRQLCWAHLLRQFLGFQTYDAEASAIGRSLELLAEAMFHLGHRVRERKVARSVAGARKAEG